MDMSTTWDRVGLSWVMRGLDKVRDMVTLDLVG